MKHHLSIDLETFSSVPIGKSGAYKYVQSPDFEILLFAYSVDDSPVEIVDLAQGEVLPDWLYKAIESPDYIKHAYNAAFEWYCLSKFYGHLLPVDQWRDTMLHGPLLRLHGGLGRHRQGTGSASREAEALRGQGAHPVISASPAPPHSRMAGGIAICRSTTRTSGACSKPTVCGDVTTEKEIERRLSAFLCRMTSRSSGRPTCSSTPEAWQ